MSQVGIGLYLYKDISVNIVWVFVWFVSYLRTYALLFGHELHLPIGYLDSQTNVVVFDQLGLK